MDDLKIVVESDVDIWKKLNLPSLVEGTLKKALKQEQSDATLQKKITENNDSTNSNIPTSKEHSTNSNIPTSEEQKKGDASTNSNISTSEKHPTNSNIPASEEQKKDDAQFDSNKPLLSEKDKENIIALINFNVPLEGILMQLGTAKETQRGQAINDFVSNLFRPPKPLPGQKFKPLHVKTLEKSLPVFHYKSEKKRNPLKKYYTFLVIGETGTGKTTLLDAFVNYLTGMEFRDNWRWKLVDENQFSKVHGSKSQTSEISYYYINDERTNTNKIGEFNIKIIDTPGFGDTKGVDKDNETVKKFEKLFKEINEIDYVLITVKSTTSRWTPGNRYVYDRVQEVFGKDAAERFIMMCTFADGAIPLATETLKPYLTFEKYFTFNNSALYIPSDGSNSMTEFFWKMGMNSVEEFLSFVLQKNALPMSLKLSSKVLEYREHLYVSIQTTQSKIQQGFRNLESLYQLIEQIRMNRKIIDENGTFTYSEVETRFEKTLLNNYYQLCNNCQITCCQICQWPCDKTESQCTYFRDGKGCPRCANCPKSSHVKCNYLVVRKEVNVPKIYDVKKQMFEEGQAGLSRSEIALSQEKAKMIKLTEEVLDLMSQVKKKLQDLDEIAMKPRLFTDEQYFEQLIQHEEESKNPGWEARLKSLQTMCERAKNINLISKAENVKDLFPQYKKLIEELIEKDDKSQSKGSCRIF